MAETKTLTGSELETALQNGKPALFIFTNGDDLRNEFSIAFNKAAGEHQDILFAKVNPKENPAIAEQFNVGSKALLIGWYDGEELVRRNRPWGTDVPLAIELLQQAYEAEQPEPDIPDSEENVENKHKETQIVENKPVAVTDETFQAEVIDYHLPVLVDFWAEWCGPCRMVAPILDKLAEEYAGKIRIAKVDVDSNPGLSQTFRVMSIPTLMMIKDRTIVFSQPGALPEPALRDLIEQLIALEVPPQEEQEETAEPTQ